MNTLIENYKEAEQALYDHVGFVEDWVVYPKDDCTEMYWSIIDNEEVKYANSIDQFNSDGDFYQDEIYKQRFYDKHVYVGEDLTMIFCNPGVDGMIWFKFFDNNKQIK